MSASQTKWSIEADYLQACNCDYGCPCEFEAPPTQGFCEGMGAWRIDRGNFGDVRLDGLGLAFLVNTPEAMHLGNGRAAFFIDEKADTAQRDALFQIATGKHGGMPFEIFAVIVTDLRGPEFAPFDFDLNGRNSSVRIGKDFSLRVEPIKNPVSGEPESIKMNHETGFIFKEAEVVSAEECRATLGDWSFSHPKKAGFVSRIKYAN